MPKCLHTGHIAVVCGGGGMTIRQAAGRATIDGASSRAVALVQ
jgi:hypothetical protein